jgi:hypothetical protein
VYTNSVGAMGKVEIEPVGKVQMAAVGQGRRREGR